jgi:hypothetical protein
MIWAKLDTTSIHISVSRLAKILNELRGQSAVCCKLPYPRFLEAATKSWVCRRGS